VGLARFDDPGWVLSPWRGCGGGVIVAKASSVAPSYASSAACAGSARLWHRRAGVPSDWETQTTNASPSVVLGKRPARVLLAARVYVALIRVAGMDAERHGPSSPRV
jgi:hypothetical protein